MSAPQIGGTAPKALDFTAFGVFSDFSGKMLDCPENSGNHLRDRKWWYWSISLNARVMRMRRTGCCEKRAFVVNQDLMVFR
jgi:hypothetical protein